MMEEIKKRLIEQKVKIEEELKGGAQHLREHEADIVEESEKADAEEEQLERDSRLSRLEKELTEVNLALVKIEQGKFGLCEKCGGEIENERLQIVPTARLCTNCKKICESCGVEIHDARVLGKALPPRCQNCDAEFEPVVTYTSSSISPQ